VARKQEEPEATKLSCQNSHTVMQMFRERKVILKMEEYSFELKL